MEYPELADYLCKKALEKYGSKIGIVAVYGSFVTGTQTSYSDLDLYAILDSGTKSRPKWSFIYNGIPVDFWSMSWKDAEQLAEGGEDHVWSVSASLFHNNKVLHSRSPEDLRRFEEIKAKTSVTQEEHLKIILDIFSRLFIYPEIVKRAGMQNDLLSARWAGWNLINSSIEIITRINNNYLTKNWGSNLHQVLDLPLLPKDFSEYVQHLTTSDNIDVILLNSVQFLESLDQIISRFQKKMIVERYDITENFADDFIGITEYIGKILSACQEKNIHKASFAASELQIWIAEILNKSKYPQYVNTYKYNLYQEVNSEYKRLQFPDLSEHISKPDFGGLKTATEKLEVMLKDMSRQYGVRNREFFSKEEIGNYFDNLA
ncbi:MAG: nucleotidyltransferase domain-containing protein [Candidatus Heimdallarchaeota archaeon]